MIAPVHTAEYSAITFGSAPAGATIGGIARIAGAWNARAMPKTKRDPEQRDHRSRLAERVEHQRARREHLCADGDEGDRLAIEVVGHRTGDEHEQEDRKELGEPHPAEIGLATGDVVRLLQQRRGLQGDAAR